MAAPKRLSLEQMVDHTGGTVSARASDFSPVEQDKHAVL
jgi:hypothetical protein